jgi:predicted permease
LELVTAIGIKILPLYLTIALGYFAVRFLDTKREAIASLLIYVIGPIVIFTASYKVKLNFEVITLPWILFIVGAVLSLASYFATKSIIKDNSRNILAFSAGTGNTGYFGIPLAIMILDDSLVNIYIFAVLASLLYESTIGFFIVAKGNFTIKQSLLKVARLPSIYALILGIVFNVQGISLGVEAEGYLENFKSGYAILGMMMIGMGLSGIKEVGFDKKFVSLALFIKFLIFPAFVLVLIFIDQTFFHLLSSGIYQVMFLFSIVPMAGNSVAIATLFNIHPQKVSLAVILSTLISMITIPIMITYLMP